MKRFRAWRLLGSRCQAGRGQRDGLKANLRLECLENRELLNVGPIDPGFGNAGSVRIDLPEALNIEVARSVQQPDGKIVTAGTVTGLYDLDFTVQRFDADGSLDTSFGKAGEVQTPLRNTINRAIGLALQADGKIVVAGTENNDFIVARYDADGSVDTTFGRGAGFVTTDFAGNVEDAYGVAVQSDGKIIAVGSTRPAVVNEQSGDINQNARSDFALARYNADGSLDSSFGNGGELTTNFGDVGYLADNVAYDVALDANGDIVIAGQVEHISGIDYVVAALARYHADGTLDGSFGAGGKVVTDFRVYPPGVASIPRPVTVALQSNGGVLLLTTVAGFSMGIDTSSFVLARYTGSGNLDPAFGSGGTATANFAGAHDTAAQGLALQQDGKIVVAGLESQTGQMDFALARFTSGGNLDAGFGNGGMVTTDFSGNTDQATGVLLQNDGKIVAVGISQSGQPNSIERFFTALARYNADGTQDSSFAKAGEVLAAFIGPGPSYASAVAVQPDGKILVVGQVTASPFFINLTRQNPDGSSSGIGGSGVGSVPSTNAAEDLATAIVLARLNPDGSLDETFGNGGVVRTDLGGSGQAAAQALALQSDGKILVAGSVGRLFAVLRYNADGTLDDSFGNAGLATTDFGGDSTTAAAAYAVTIQADGKIVAAGWTSNADQQSGSLYHGDFALARFNANGSLDVSFGNHGLVTTDFGGSLDQANAVLVQPDGKIVTAGFAGSEGYVSGGPLQKLLFRAFALARYNGDGTLDATFGNGGRSIYAAEPSADNHTFDTANGIVLQPDSKIVVAGDTGAHFTLARFTSAGSIDTSFGNGGLVHADSTSSAQSVALQPDGTIVAAGGTIVASYDPASESGPIVSTFPGGARGLALQPDGQVVLAGSIGSAVTSMLVARYQNLDAPSGQDVNRRYILHLYQSLLGREADALGLANWSNLLYGGESKAQVIAGIEHGVEYAWRQVQQLYHQYLHRGADGAGLASWVPFLQRGNTTQALAELLASSPEYMTANAANLLTALYADLFNRPLDAGGRAAFQPLLNAGMNPGQVTAMLFDSVEHQQDEVQAAYQAILHRQADAGGLHAWQQALQHGLAEEVLRAQLLTSVEYLVSL